MERTEAIEVIRKCWPVNRNGLLSDALKTLIPEFRESEDERVRKEIYNFLIDMECKKEWISYLEKQKEQKPAEWKPLSESMEALLLAIEGKWDAIKPTGYMSRRLEDLYDGLVNTFDVDEKYLSNLPKTEYTEKDIEEIKALKEKIDSSMETKPAEWSEDYREEDLRTRFAFYTYKDEDDVLYLSNVFVEETSRNKGFGTKILAAAEKVAETLGVIIIRLKVKQNSPANAWYRKHGYGFMAFEGNYDWLEKTLEYMKPVKQEWSEEDEKMAYFVNQFLEYHENADPTAKSCKDWFNGRLKSLRPQPKQEWSKSDEEQLIQIIENGVTEAICKEGFRFHFDEDYAKNLVGYIKSFIPQPHWKPSKKQMKALGDCVLGRTPDADARITLEILWDNLQKLL